jgi:hypothetical protein
MKWLLSGVALLLMAGWFWFSGSAEPEQPEAAPSMISRVQNTTQHVGLEKEPESSGEDVAVVYSDTSVQEPTKAEPEQASSICLEGRGCTLDLQENWHLRLISSNAELSRAKIELLFKSRNFREAAEQLHYSHQYEQDNLNTTWNRHCLTSRASLAPEQRRQAAGIISVWCNCVCRLKSRRTKC